MLVSVFSRSRIRAAAGAALSSSIRYVHPILPQDTSRFPQPNPPTNPNLHTTPRPEPLRNAGP